MSERFSPETISAEVSAREVIDLLRRRRGTLLACLLLSIGVALFVTWRTTPVYRAQARMIIEQSPLRTAKIESDSPLAALMEPTQPHDLDTQVEALQSSQLPADVARQASDGDPRAVPSLTVAQVGQTDLIELSSESTNPRAAKVAANLLMDRYIQESQERTLISVRKTRQFVQRKLGEAQDQLRQAEARLRRFKEQNHLADLPSEMAGAITTTGSLQAELQRNQNELAGLRSQIDQVRSQLGREPAVIPGGHTMGPNPMIDGLEADIQKLKLQRITLLRTLKPHEPEVLEVDAQISQLQQRLRSLPRQIVNSVTVQPNPQRAALRGQLEGLESQARAEEPKVARMQTQLRQSQERLQQFPAWETQLAALQRVRDQAQQTTKTLSDELSDLRLREQAQGVTALPVSRAGLPTSPVRPRRVLNLAVAVALGLILGVGAACLRDMADDRLYGVQEAERSVGLPVLGRIPYFGRGDRPLIPLDGESPVKESYRRLRAGITAGTAGEPVRSIMVTSATPGEGKSTTAANLAMALALQGRRVILVDADLRNPSLATLFGTPTFPGLTDGLTGGALTPACLHATHVPDLLLLPAGTRLPNAPELLAGPRLAELTRELSGMADLVILDTPPCLPVADAEVLGSHVDAALLVVGLGRTYRDAVRRTGELLDQAHVRLLGAVVNRVRPGDRGYPYRYTTHPVPWKGEPAAVAAAIPNTSESAARAPATGSYELLWEEEDEA